MTRWRLFGLGAEAAEIWYTVGYLLSVLGHTNSNLLFFVILLLILLAFLLQFHKHKFYYITIYLWYSSPRFALVCFTIVFLLSSMSNTWGTGSYICDSCSWGTVLHETWFAHQASVCYKEPTLQRQQHSQEAYLQCPKQCLNSMAAEVLTTWDPWLETKGAIVVW